MGYNVLDGTESFSFDKVKHHSNLAIECLDAIKKMEINTFGQIINAVHDSQKDMIPNYEHDDVSGIIKEKKNSHLGVKLMGAGGYGYMMIVSDDPESDFIDISIRT